MRQLFIDSRDRIPGGSSTDFTIQFREQLVLGPADSFRIDNLRIPLVIPLIERGFDDKLWYTVAGQRYSVTLPPGNYSGTDLATLIQTALATPVSWPTINVAYPTGTTFTVLYDNHVASLAITCSKTTFHVLTDAEVTAANTSYMSLPTFASRLFQNPYAYTGTTPITLTWSYCSVQAVDVMFLTSSRLSNQDTFGPNGSTDTIMTAVPTSDFASVLLQSMPAEVTLNCPTISTSTLDFQLRDRNYNILQNLPNISFVLTLRT